jgi:hypothetical protein
VTYVQNRKNVRNATSESTFTSHSDLWHFQTRAAAEFPGISHTPASSMDRTHIVGSSYRPIPRDAGVVHKDEGGIKREGAETEKDILSLIIMARSGTAGDHADVAERTHDATVQHTKVATHKNRGMIKEKLGREEKGPHKITLSTWRQEEYMLVKGWRLQRSPSRIGTKMGRRLSRWTHTGNSQGMVWMTPV